MEWVPLFPIKKSSKLTLQIHVHTATPQSRVPTLCVIILFCMNGNSWPVDGAHVVDIDIIRLHLGLTVNVQEYVPFKENYQELMYVLDFYLMWWLALQFSMHTLSHNHPFCFLTLMVGSRSGRRCRSFASVCHQSATTLATRSATIASSSVPQMYRVIR